MGMVVEGVETCKAVYALAKEKNIEMPITTAVYNVLYKGHDVREEIQCLMGRELNQKHPLKNTNKPNRRKTDPKKVRKAVIPAAGLELVSYQQQKRWRKKCYQS